MAACNVGVSGLKVCSLNLSPVRPKFTTLQSSLGLTLRIKKVVRFANGLDSLARSKRASVTCPCSISGDNSVSANSDQDTRSAGAVSKGIPNYSQVESLITDICNAKSIAEFELNIGGYMLRMKRQSALAHPSIPAPVNINTAIDPANTNGLALSESLAISKAVPCPSDIQTSLEKVSDEVLFTLKSPLVGYFRRSRTIKGKRAPPSCTEKQHIKEGQVLCYIEQLGSEIPVESDVSGEVINILREDGEPVGYSEKLITILLTQG